MKILFWMKWNHWWPFLVESFSFSFPPPQLFIFSTFFYIFRHVWPSPEISIIWGRENFVDRCNKVPFFLFALFVKNTVYIFLNPYLIKFWKKTWRFRPSSNLFCEKLRKQDPHHRELLFSNLENWEEVLTDFQNLHIHFPWNSKGEFSRATRK